MYPAFVLLWTAAAITFPTAVVSTDVVSVEKGSGTELPCQSLPQGTPSSVRWSYRHLDEGPEKQKVIYQRLIGDRTYFVPHSPSIVMKGGNITLNDALPNDTGIYDCMEESATNVEHRIMYRVVIFSMGTGPKLNVSLVEDGPDADTEEDALVTCSASEVSPEPYLIVKINGVERNVTEHELTGVNGVFKVSVALNLTKAEAVGATIDCELLYDADVVHPVYVDKQVFQVAEKLVSTVASVTSSGNTELNTTTPQTDAASSLGENTKVIMISLAAISFLYSIFFRL